MSKLVNSSHLCCVDLTGETIGGGDTKSYDNKNIIMIQNDQQQKPSENIKNDLLHIFS